MRVEIDDLIDLGGIAEICGVTTQAVVNWRARFEDFADCFIDWNGHHPVAQWSKARRWLIKTKRLDKSAA